MALFQALYMSVPNVGDDSEVLEIMRVSREKNARLGVTGALAYNGERFVQVLEGEARALSGLLVTIGGDGRHTDFTLIGFQRIRERCFPRWSMAYISREALGDSIASHILKAQAGNPEGIVYDAMVESLRMLTP